MRLQELVSKIEQKNNIYVDVDSITTDDNVVSYAYHLIDINSSFGWHLGKDNLADLENFQMFA